MVNRYTLGSIVFGIFLLAILGVSRAMSWLTQSTAKTDSDIVTVESDRTGIDRAQNNGALGSRDQNTDTSRIGQSNDGFTDTTFSQTESADGTALPLQPLEKAGTFIQRQQRVEEDKVIAATEVNVIPVANNSTAAQSNTIPPQNTAQTKTATPKPAEQPKASPPAPAVPALW